MLMPLPLNRLHSVLKWMETNSVDVIREVVAASEENTVPNPMMLVARVLLRVDVPEVAFNIFSGPKDPETGEQINKGLSKEWFEEYLDAPTAKMCFEKFVEINDIENLIKNLQSLPVVKKLMEVSSLTFGIPFLNSLRQSTDSAQTKPEGSPSLKSTDSLTPITDGNLEQTSQSSKQQHLM